MNSTNNYNNHQKNSCCTLFHPGYADTYKNGRVIYTARTLMLKINPDSTLFITTCKAAQVDENNQITASPILYKYQYIPTKGHDVDKLLKQDH